MERVISDTFITTPTFKSYQASETEQKIPENLREKIINILRSFKEKQLLNQAINNIGIPKSFVNVAYVESRPEHQLAKIYATISSLKKQVLRIKKYSDPSHGAGNLVPIQSLKIISQSKDKRSQKKTKQQVFLFLKKQLEPQAKIKLAIEKQLLYRQKLQDLSKKGEQADKIKLELLQKRKETAKFMNKKAIEVYQKQKQNQQKWFEKILQSNIEMQNSSSPMSSVQRNFNSANSTRRQQYHEMVKERLQRQKLSFQTHLQEQVMERLQKQTSVKYFKHKRMNSLNDRIIFSKMKSMQIRQRKITTAQEQEAARLRKIIQKEQKFLENKNNKKFKDNGGSESTQGQSQTTAFITNQNFFRANETRTVNFDKEDEKENMIIEKIARKNEIKQLLINEKVQKMKEKHRLEETRREAFKQSKIKLFTELHDNSESFVYQKDLFGGKNSATNLTEPSVCDKQQENIRKKHQNTLKNVSTDQAILRLRKLPKFVLEKKLKDIKNKQLSDMLAQDIVKFLI